MRIQASEEQEHPPGIVPIWNSAKLSLRPDFVQLDELLQIHHLIAGRAERWMTHLDSRCLERPGLVIRMGVP
jgi:hypothetical protein